MSWTRWRANLICKNIISDDKRLDADSFIELNLKMVQAYRFLGDFSA